MPQASHRVCSIHWSGGVFHHHDLLLQIPCAGVDLLSLDGQRAVRCLDGVVPFAEVRRFLRVARWIYKALGASVCDPTCDRIQRSTWGGISLVLLPMEWRVSR